MLAIEALRKSFGKKAVLHDVAFQVAPGETVGLVGSSGSGKSTIARCILGLEAPSGGRVLWDGQPIRTTVARRPWRKDVQIVFQDPRSSLSPRWTIRRSLLEPLQNWFPQLDGGPRARRIEALLEQVGLERRYLDRYPHELSTGQCQRACIARALAPEPRLLVLDEPLSALDVTIQAQILRLLRQIQAERQLSYLFISHDVVVVSELCTRVLVLERGRIVEEAASADLLTRPRHPYTRSLVADTPVVPWRVNVALSSTSRAASRGTSTRAAPAAGDCAGAAQACTGAHSGRGDVTPGRGERADGAQRHRGADGGTHDDRDRAPALRRARRRPHRRAGRRPRGGPHR